MAKIEHVLVLMFENRSFDHMLGFLNHPNQDFEGLKGNESNIGPGGQSVFVSPDAGYTIDPGPGHSHQDTMMQLTGKAPGETLNGIDNSGFVRNYEAIGGLGPEIMRCQSRERIRFLATLALEFAVCDHWFSSVPGETWPNRNFTHAGTSDGEVDIVFRPYNNKTIFDQLSEANKHWLIYHDGIVCQSMAFPHLWGPPWRQRFRSLSHLEWSIRNDMLPDYAFIEPDYEWPDANSQHPANNRSIGDEFLAGEQLIRRIYEMLVANPTVWHKTLLLITYDEHGGFYDHVPPPQGNHFRDGFTSDNGFKFDLLGCRVPAVLVSPYIPRGTVDQTVYDHTSIIATVRALFAPGAGQLTPRDGQANTFHHIASLDVPRAMDDIPRFALPADGVDFMVLAENPPPEKIDHFQASLYQLTGSVEVELTREQPGVLAVLEADAIVNEMQADGPINEGAMAEAVAYQERVGQMFRESGDRLVVLRNQAGETRDYPSVETVENALAEVENAEDEAAKIVLADMEQRVIVIYPHGRTELLFEDETAKLTGLSAADQLELCRQFLNGQFETLRAAFVQGE